MSLNMSAVRLVRRAHDEERGQATPLLIGAMLLFVVMGVLVMDFGMMFADRREAQRAVDLAALASAQELPTTAGDPAAVTKFNAARTAASAYLQGNGFAVSDPTATITVTTSYRGDPASVEVVARRPYDWSFGDLFRLAEEDIGARAVAQLHTRPGEYGIMALSDTGCPGFSVRGSVILRVVGGGVLVNSDCEDMATDITGQVIVESAMFDRYFEGGTRITSNTTVTPMPQALGWRVDDPLAGLAEPDLGMLSTSPDSGGTAAAPALRSIQGGGSLTLHPGIYYGGLAFSGSKDVTFEPGLYVIAGGGFKVSGNGTLRGDGVTIFNTTHNGSCGSIELAGGRPVEFTPPDSGPYDGLTFWQARSCTAQMDHSGNVESLAGLIYLPTAHYELAGEGQMTGVQVIASTVEVRGNGELTINYGGQVTSQVWTVSLLE